MFSFETKVNHVFLESIRVKLGFVGKLMVDNMGRSEGLCLFFMVDLLSYIRFHIKVKIKSHGSMV